MINGKTHYKWPFSIAMLNYQRVLVNKDMAGCFRKNNPRHRLRDSPRRVSDGEHPRPPATSCQPSPSVWTDAETKRWLVSAQSST